MRSSRNPPLTQAYRGTGSCTRLTNAAAIHESGFQHGYNKSLCARLKALVAVILFSQT